ncbi:Methyltranfer-dom domain-containing protein [Fusarium falciforme]|uniref:Methyltranfer-dom domain-containing protein n=1 Tax=Fusarium falciforme TaxID=195108 RepID=UPI0022FFDF95|nr:Methyltranfer-dom domain-containing protein [Fusarium falciforme]WAO84835.1 Methyltranfer-dom domain-containing protein [Fusarium falciforme]
MESQEIYNQVIGRYGSIVKSSTGHYEQTEAKAFGYTEQELAGIPEGANLGLSCGNPTAIARLRVSMIDKANVNKYCVDVSNVEFIKSPVTSIPAPGNTADCIISNCVINVVPAGDKQLAFNKMFRLLKPGGRVAISDILARKELTDEMKKDMALYVGCIAGASQVSEYDSFLRNAGFEDILIVDSNHDLNVYWSAADGEPPYPKHGSYTEQESCPQDQPSLMADEASRLAYQLDITDFNEWAGSFQVYAVKPVAS